MIVDGTTPAHLIPLTRHQLAVLRILVELVDNDEVPPTMTELAAEMDMPGRGNVHRYLTQLEERGYIRRWRGRRRAIEILHRPPPLPFDEVFVLSPALAVSREAAK